MRPLPPWPYPTHIAHRGGGRFAPENTLAAMRVGAEHGFQMVEFDVKLSRDRIAFLMHDDYLDRTTDGFGRADATDYVDLMRADAGGWHSPRFAGETLASLQSVARFAVANDIACNIEIKPSPRLDEETGRTIALAARELWRNAKVAPLLSSFSEIALAAAQAAAPELPRALLVSNIPDDWRERLAKYDCVALNINQRDATAELIADVHNAGYRIAAWTVNDPARAALLLSWHIDALFTDELVSISPTA